MPVSRWFSIRPTLVSAAKASSSYSAKVALVNVRIQPGRVIHVYTGRAPALSLTSVQLSWNANPAGDNVTGYRIYYGAAPGGPYTSSGSPIVLGNVTTTSVPLAGKPSPMYMRLTAVNANGESAFSSEITNA